MSAFKSKPSDATFSVSSSPVSSNAMKTPGSPYSVAPRTRNSIASNVLPQPAPPQTSVGRPVGNPPPVISSSPRMPVHDFRKVFGADDFFVLFIVAFPAISVFQGKIVTCYQTQAHFRPSSLPLETQVLSSAELFRIHQMQQPQCNAWVRRVRNFAGEHY